MTFSIWPLVRTSDQTCSCTKMPSYCTRQARATLDTVSPVESETRWTWKLRLATTQLTPQARREKRGIAGGDSGIAMTLPAKGLIRDPTCLYHPDIRPLGTVRHEHPSNSESGQARLIPGRFPSTGPWGRVSNEAHPHVPHPLLLLL